MPRSCYRLAPGVSMKKGWLFILVVAAAAGAGAYYYWQQQGAAGRLDIQTAEVKRGDVRRVVATSGTVSALVTVDIGSQLSGNIGAVNVDYSTEVNQGEVLARIEPASIGTRVREEEGAVAGPRRMLICRWSVCSSATTRRAAPR